MEIEKKKPRSLVADIKDAVDIIGAAIGTAASPSVLLLATLFNSTGEGRGFDGYVTNPLVNVVQQGGTQIVTYRNFSIIPYMGQGFGIPSGWTKGYAVKFADGINYLGWNFATIEDGMAKIDQYWSARS